MKQTYLIAISLALLIGIQVKSFGQSTKRPLYQELSAGGTYFQQSKLLIDNVFTLQALPSINSSLVGTQINYRVGYNRFLFSANYQFATSNNKDNGFLNQSVTKNSGITVSYALFYEPKTKVYFGISGQGTSLKVNLSRQNRVQNLNNLVPDNIDLYNNQFLMGARLLSYLFDDSDFPFIIGIGYDYGTGGIWKINEGNLNQKMTENIKRVSFSIDIPILRK